MTSLLILVAVVIIIAFVIEVLFGRRPQKAEYEYRKKDCIMTEAEHKCFNALEQAVGDRYYIFPQVHLPSILDHKIKGQKWVSAFFHISQKSVDFVLCDKEKMSPILAIELDDWSHNRPDRQERDREVEQIFKDAHMPILRLKDHIAFEDVERFKKDINEKINPISQTKI